MYDMACSNYPWILVLKRFSFLSFKIAFYCQEPDVGADFRPNVLAKFVTSNASTSNPSSCMESTDFGELLSLYLIYFLKNAREVQN